MKTTIGHYEKSTPLNYPGERHEDNFMLVHGDVLESLPVDPYEAIKQADELLASQGFAPVSERVPVLAFGRNASPEGAASKTEKYKNGIVSTDDLGTFPMLKASLKGHDVVWHGRPGQTSNYFAELVDTPQAPDASVEVWVQFLTTEQLASIHATEGVTYEVAEVPHVALGNGLEIDTIGYTAKAASNLLDDDGNKISVKGINREGHAGVEMNVREALDYTLGQEAVAAAMGTITTDEFLEIGRTAPLAERKANQLKIQDALVAEGKSAPFAYANPGYRYFRADFDSLPRGIGQSTEVPDTYQLMEQHLAGVRPLQEVLDAKKAALAEKYPDETAKQIAKRAVKLLDPAQAMRQKTHDELHDANREARLAEWKKRFDIHQKEFDDNHSNNQDNNL